MIEFDDQLLSSVFRSNGFIVNEGQWIDSSSGLERRLRVVGAPAEPEEIGSTREATLADAHRAIYMRDRYMALDLLDATGQLDAFARAALSLDGPTA